MTDDLIQRMREHVALLRAQADRYEQAITLMEGGPHANGARPAKAKAAKQGPRPTVGSPNGSPSNRRYSLNQRTDADKAQALKLLAEGKTVKEVARQFRVTDSAVYLWRKAAKGK